MNDYLGGTHVPNEVISEEYMDLLVESETLNLYDEKYQVTYIDYANSMVHIPSVDIDKCSIGDYPYHVFPSIYVLESINSLEESGVIKTRNNPNFNLLGQGVLVGIVDTGIDYLHEAFLNEDGTSRIGSIWDQTINNGGVPPESFTYGTEYSNTMLNIALNSTNPLSIVPSKDEIGHGTKLAGIIAGNAKLSKNFSGVVPNATIVVVKLKLAKLVVRDMFLIPADKICYQETDIILGVRYLLSVAAKLNRPLAICIGLGSNQGGHDGYSSLSRYLAFASQLARTAVVLSAGNEGNTKRHYAGFLDRPQEIKEFELRVGANENNFSMELWQRAPHRMILDISSPSGEYITPIYPRIGECREIRFIFEPTTIWVNNDVFEVQTGDQLILMRFRNPQEGIWKFRVSNLESLASEFHVWLPSGNLISDETYFIDSNPDTTITSPGASIESITITAYNPSNGSIAIASSRGYTRTDIIKPDLAAPGVNLVCPTKNNSYGLVTGTGAAAAHATGIVAMVLEWAVVQGNNTSIRGFDIKKLLIRGANRAPDLQYPNKIWGYGKIDIYGLFEVLS